MGYRLRPETISPYFADLSSTTHKIVFHDSSLYSKQLSIYYVLWLISASADRIGYISNFSSTGVPNLGYMYPWGYICLSEGVHL